MSPSERCDVVVVGGRCAGSPLATALARSGMRVTLVEKAHLPSDTLSTHIFQNEAARALESLGVLDRVLATGAPWLEQVDGRAEDVRFVRPWPKRPGDPGGGLCVRRPLLDTLLLERAQEAGVQVRTGATVDALLEQDGRVAGVRTRADTGDHEVRAPLVVGADGRGSTVARLAGARAYNLFPNQRAGFWGYYEGVSWPEPATLFFHRWGEEFVIACPADSGLFLVVTIPSLDRVPQFRADLGSAFDAHVDRCEPVAQLVEGGRRIGPPRAALRWTCYFRQATGPGWVLTGDAGHFKDPAPGQGISDALRQAERLAGALEAGLGGGTPLDRALADWWRWRDADAAEMHWFAGDVGQGGGVPPPLAEIVRRLAEKDRLEPFLDVFNHRTRPSEVLTPLRLTGAAGRLLARGAPPRHRVLRATWRIMAADVRHRRLNRHPAYARDAASVSSEIDD